MQHLLTYDDNLKAYVWLGDRSSSEIPKAAGFWWHRIVSRHWATRDPMAACRLVQYAPDSLKAVLSPWRQRFDERKFLTYDNGQFVWLGPIHTRAITSAAGLTWDKKAERWVTKDAARAVVLQKYADEAALARLGVALRQVEESRAHEDDGAIDIPVPSGIHPLTGEPFAYRPFQKAGIVFAYKYRRVLNGDEMGLGKTIQGSGLINLIEARELPSRFANVLCVVPASMRLVWRDEFDLWLVRKGRKIEVLDGRKAVPSPDANAVIVNYDIVHPGTDVYNALVSREWDLLISDEAHFVKNPDAKRTIALYGRRAKTKRVGKNRGEKVEAVVGIVSQCDRVLSLTGTPIPNRPKELYPTLRALRPGQFGDFMHRYCGAVRHRFGWDFDGASNLEELQTRLRAGVMVRRLKKDVLSELPPKTRELVILNSEDFSDLLDKERAAIQAMSGAYEAATEIGMQVAYFAACGDREAAKAAAKRYEEAVRNLSVDKVAFEEMSRVRLQIGLAKVPYVVEHCLHVLESVQKLIVFAHHREVISGLMEAFRIAGMNPVKVVGGMSKEEKDEARDAFQNDPSVRVFVGNTIAAGVGLTLTAASHVIVAELDHVPGNVAQAEDRAHRIGQKDNVTVQHIVIDGSQDANMAKRMIAKQAVADAALDGGGGQVAFDVDLNIAEIPETKYGSVPIRPKAYPTYSPEQLSVAREAVHYMCALDSDHASYRNEAGWSKIHVVPGRELAMAPVWTPGQAWFAIKMLERYKNTQLDPAWVSVLWPEKG